MEGRLLFYPFRVKTSAENNGFQPFRNRERDIKLRIHTALRKVRMRSMAAGRCLRQMNQRRHPASTRPAAADPSMENEMVNNPDNDNNLEGPMVFIIIGKAYEVKDTPGIDLHIMLRAPDDDTAVREALNALSEEGFIEAELDQIGVLEEEPVEEPHASAYQGALEGEVAIIRFDN